MKKQFKGFISGVVITSVLFTNILPVLAKTGTEQLNATYNNIKMYLNGEKINSPAGEPFMVNGTTYVPLRVERV